MRSADTGPDAANPACICSTACLWGEWRECINSACSINYTMFVSYCSLFTWPHPSGVTGRTLHSEGGRVLVLQSVEVVMQFPFLASMHATHLAVVLRQCIHACLSLALCCLIIVECKQHNDATGCHCNFACVPCELLYRWACLHRQRVCMCVCICAPVYTSVSA